MGILLIEAIEHCLDKYQELEVRNCGECAADHLRLGTWLKELQYYRDKHDDIECFNQAHSSISHNHKLDEMKRV